MLKKLGAQCSATGSSTGLDGCDHSSAPGAKSPFLNTKNTASIPRGDNPFLRLKATAGAPRAGVASDSISNPFLQSTEPTPLDKALPTGEPGASPVILYGFELTKSADYEACVKHIACNDEIRSKFIENAAECHRRKPSTVLGECVKIDDGRLYSFKIGEHGSVKNILHDVDAEAFKHSGSTRSPGDPFAHSEATAGYGHFRGQHMNAPGVFSTWAFHMSASKSSLTRFICDSYDEYVKHPSDPMGTWAKTEDGNEFQHTEDDDPCIVAYVVNCGKNQGRLTGVYNEATLLEWILRLRGVMLLARNRNEVESWCHSNLCA
jgi:hypothetical protein